MATNESRSMNRDLSEGMTDGKYKKLVTRERGGVVDPLTEESRRDLSRINYDREQAPVMLRPDGKVFRG